MRGLLRPAALAAGLALAACGPSAEPEGAGEAAPQPERDAAPGFTLRDLSGERVSLEALRGRPVVIDFWATWCPPCLRQIPVLNEFREAHAEESVAVLGIATDAGGRKVVAPFAEKHDIVYRVLLGDERLAQRYGAVGYPTLFVLDARGRIVHRHAGVVSREGLEAALASARGGGGPETATARAGAAGRASSPGHGASKRSAWSPGPTDPPRSARSRTPPTGSGAPTSAASTPAS